MRDQLRERAMMDMLALTKVLKEMNLIEWVTNSVSGTAAAIKSSQPARIAGSAARPLCLSLRSWQNWIREV